MRRAGVSKCLEGESGASEEGVRQVHAPGEGRERPCACFPLAPWNGAGIQSGTWRPWHTALPSRVLRPQQGSMPPFCLSRRARPAWSEGGREARVAGSCWALPWGLGSWKGSWEEPWAPSHAALELGSGGKAGH